MQFVLFCCLLTYSVAHHCPQGQQNHDQIDVITNRNNPQVVDNIVKSAPNIHHPTLLDTNPVLKTLTATYLRYELVDGWVGRYKLHTDVKNWFDAQEVCAQEGANLLVIDSPREARAVRALIDYTGTPKYWIGFHDIYKEGDYVTIFKESLNTTGFAVWGTRRPSIKPQRCGVFANFPVDSKYSLDVYVCLVELPYICEEEIVAKQKHIPTLQQERLSRNCNEFIPTPQQQILLQKGYEFVPSVGSLYKYHHQLRASWQSAVDTCAREGAHMVIINSEEEDLALSSFIVKGSIWTGVHDQYEEGNYVTIFNDTLQSTGYSKWNSDNPTGGRMNNCVSFAHYSDTNHGLYDSMCTTVGYFMCEQEV